MSIADLIRPWWPSGTIGHLYADCPELLAWGPDPREGAGWLDLRKSRMCERCVRRFDRNLADQLFAWDSECITCETSASEENDDGEPLTEADVRAWQTDHRCRPWFEMRSPRPLPGPDPRQLPLFDLPALKDAA